MKCFPQKRGKTIFLCVQKYFISIKQINYASIFTQQNT